MQIKSNAAITPTTRPCVLMIEDNEGDIELARITLERVDCYMVFLRDALAAIDYLRKNPAPNLILLDLNMPCMSGKEFLEAIKNNKNLEDVPVLLLTSSTDPQDIQDCYRLRANGYIVKPYNASERKDMAKRVAHFLSENCTPLLRSNN